MTTALQLITDALQEIGVVADGETPSADQSAHGLRALNRMLGRWSQRRLMLPSLAEVSVPLDGSASYTIGPTSADVTAARPIRIEMARAVDASGFEYQVAVLNQQRWNSVLDKTTTGGPPDRVYYAATNTNGTLYVYPVASGYTLRLDCRSVVASFATLTTQLALPDGYEDAIIPSLADALASSYGIKTPGDVLRRSTVAIRAIQNANAESLTLRVGLASGENFMVERGY